MFDEKKIKNGKESNERMKGSEESWEVVGKNERVNEKSSAEGDKIWPLIEILDRRNERWNERFEWSAEREKRYALREKRSAEREKILNGLDKRSVDLEKMWVVLGKITAEDEKRWNEQEKELVERAKRWADFQDRYANEETIWEEQEKNWARQEMIWLEDDRKWLKQSSKRAEDDSMPADNDKKHAKQSSKQAEDDKRWEEKDKTMNSNLRALRESLLSADLRRMAELRARLIEYFDYRVYCDAKEIDNPPDPKLPSSECLEERANKFDGKMGQIRKVCPDWDVALIMETTEQITVT